MKRTILLFFTFTVMITLYTACSMKKGNEAIGSEKRQYTHQQNQVNIKILHSRTFKDELVSNGKLRAIRKSELRFEISEKIESIFVKNGDYVKKDKKLASLHDFNLKQILAKATIQYKKL